ncbi:acyl-CoA thioesterase [Salipiger abyssi]|uniref:acyl-CoA thioesterase n=1 Tax=Salipiger abyssi TaxID=1250539 RepID=UPI00405968C0
MSETDRMLCIRSTREVPFGDCDPAGILYTPRALDYCLEAIDAVWKSVLGGIGWYELNMDHDRGTPFVDVNLSFSHPITPRLPLDLVARVEHLGTSSVTFVVYAEQGGKRCFHARLTSVIVAKSTLTKVSGDDWLRQRLQAALGDGQG